MHIELTEDIFENREKILVKLQNAEAKKIIENAKNNWIEYTPKSIESNIVGVDSSQNQLKFQGHTIWAVKANAVDVNSKVLFEKHDYGHDAPSDVGKDGAVAASIRSGRQNVGFFKYSEVRGAVAGTLAPFFFPEEFILGFLMI